MDSYNRGRLDVLLEIKKIFDDNKYPEYLEYDLSEYLEKEFKKYQPVYYADTDSVIYSSEDFKNLGAIKYLGDKK